LRDGMLNPSKQSRHGVAALAESTTARRPSQSHV